MPTLKEISPYQDNNGNSITGSPSSQSRINIQFSASNCKVEIEKNCNIHGLDVRMAADGARLFIGEGSTIRGAYFRLGLNCTIAIGKNLNMIHSGTFSAAEGTQLLIGDNCLFANSIEIRTDDSHPIFDRDTGKRVNPSRNVKLGQKVWLAAGALILGGSSIGNGCVIGARAVVTKEIPDNCIAVGIPAQVVRENIEWFPTHLSINKPWDFPSIDSIHPTNPKPNNLLYQPLKKRMITTYKRMRSKLF